MYIRLQPIRRSMSFEVCIRVSPVLLLLQDQQGLFNRYKVAQSLAESGLNGKSEYIH